MKRSKIKKVVEFGALVFSVNFIQSMGWDGVCLVGDNLLVLQSYACGNASVGPRHFEVTCFQPLALIADRSSVLGPRGLQPG